MIIFETMQKDQLLNEIIKSSKIHPSRISNVYIFGSRVYGTNSSNSDWDVIMIAKNSVESIEIKGDVFNLHIYTLDKFKSDLDWHKPNNLECIWAPEWAKLKEDIKFDDFKVNFSKLRHSFSHSSSNSWVKCKKKLELNEDYNVGIKSMFHSLRIPIFGIQIAKNSKITNFKSANWIWEKIKSNENWTWEELDNEFRDSRNSILSEFRRSAPKIED